MKKTLFPLIFLVLNSFTASAQQSQGGGAIPLGWAQDLGGNIANSIHTVAIDRDNNDNIYIAGYNTGTAAISDDGQHLLTYSGNNIVKNGFIAKYNTQGSYIWHISLSDVAGCEVTDIAVSPDSGYVYVYGLYYSSTLDFDPGPNSVGFSVPASAGSAFFAKYDLNGNFLWVKGIGSGIGNGNGLNPSRIAISPDETRIAIGGNFLYPLDLDPSAGTLTISSSGLFDGYVAAYSSNGGLIGGQATGVGNNDWVSDLAYGPGNVLYPLSVGRFTVNSGELDFQIKEIQPDMITEISYTGGVNSNGDETANAIVVNSASQVFVSGNFNSSYFYVTDSLGNTSNSISPVWTNYANSFLVALNANTSFNFYNVMGDQFGPSDFLSLALDETNQRVYAAGYFNTGIYMAGYQYSGGQVDGYSAYDTVPNSAVMEQCNGIVFSSLSELLATGNISGYPDMDSNPGFYILHDSPDNRIYLAKYYESVTATVSENNAAQIFVYPNPATDILNITSVKAGDEISIYNMNGELVLKQKHNSGTVNISELSSGIYFVELANDKGITRQKFVKN